jgi:uncharacterized membrane protein
MENENKNSELSAQVVVPQPSTAGGQKSETAQPKLDAGMVVGTYILFFLPLVIERLKKDEFYRFHSRQSLGLLLSSVVAGFISNIVMPIGGILQLGVFVLWVISLISALKGKKELTPVLGEYFNKINI